MKKNRPHSLILACSAFAVLVIAGCGIFSSDDFPGPPPGTGDIDLNGVPFEQADFDRFMAFLMRNPPRMTREEFEEAVSNTDINGDSKTLMISDLVYFEAVRNGAAFGSQKLDFSLIPVEVDHDAGTYRANVPLGGMLFLVQSGPEAERDTVVDGIHYYISGLRNYGEQAIIALPTGPDPIPTEKPIYAPGTFVSLETVAPEGARTKTSVALNLPDFKINGNHPNPFNPNTKVSFDVYRQGEYLLEVHDPRGRLVKTSSGVAQIGTVIIDVDLFRMPSGVYFYSVQMGDRIASGKMILQRLFVIGFGAGETRIGARVVLAVIATVAWQSRRLKVVL